MLIVSLTVVEERMKVSWPLSAREAVVQYFVFEYFKDDLIVVLLNSVIVVLPNELVSIPICSF